MYRAATGVCGVLDCEAVCLADYFSGEGDGGVSSSSGACDGYQALMHEVCGDVCSTGGRETMAAIQEVRRRGRGGGGVSGNGNGLKVACVDMRVFLLVSLVDCERGKEEITWTSRGALLWWNC